MGIVYFLQRRSDRAMFELGKGGATDRLLVFAHQGALARREAYDRNEVLAAYYAMPYEDSYDAIWRDWFRLPDDVDGIAGLISEDYAQMTYSEAQLREVAARLARFATGTDVSLIDDCSSDEQMDRGLVPGAPGVVGSRYFSDDFPGPDGAPADPGYMRDPP